MQIFLEFIKNEWMTYPNLRETMNVIQIGKFIALNAFKKKLGRSHTSNLRAHLKVLRCKEANTVKRNTWQEIIKLCAKINKIETKRTIQRITEIKNWFFGGKIK